MWMSRGREVVMREDIKTIKLYVEPLYLTWLERWKMRAGKLPSGLWNCCILLSVLAFAEPTLAQQETDKCSSVHTGMLASNETFQSMIECIKELQSRVAELTKMQDETNARARAEVEKRIRDFAEVTQKPAGKLGLNTPAVSCSPGQVVTGIQIGLEGFILRCAIPVRGAAQ
jgi:hypothetical protein